MEVYIQLPVKVHTSDTSNASKMELNYSIEDCEVKDVIIFEVNSIEMYEPEDTDPQDIDYTIVGVNGNSLICTLCLEEVEDIVTRSISNLKKGILDKITYIK